METQQDQQDELADFYPLACSRRTRAREGTQWGRERQLSPAGRASPAGLPCQT